MALDGRIVSVLYYLLGRGNVCYMNVIVLCMGDDAGRTTMYNLGLFDGCSIQLSHRAAPPFTPNISPKRGYRCNLQRST